MVALLALFACSAGAAEPGPPNFVFIIVDDLGRQDVGVYGSDWYETPNMDALAGGGVRFDNAYAAHPRCVPSRLGIMSGRYPAAFGIPGFQDRSAGKHALPLSTVTFAEVLRDAGYRTAYVGKWHLGKDGGGPAEQGFTTSIMAGASGAPPSYFLPYEVSRKTSDSKSFPDYAGGLPDEYLTDRLTDEALAFISESSDKPFLLVLAHYAVHTPIEAPVALTDKYRGKSRDRGLSDDPESDIVIDGTGETKTAQNHPVYSGMVESVDANIGRIVAQLRESGIEDHTVVIVTSDHGGLSSRGLGNKRELATTNLPYRHGKGWLYDGGIRVPLIVSWPGRIDSPKVSSRRTTGTDHYATLLELAGIERNSEQASDSVSYAQSLHGSADPRESMFWHSSLGRPLQTGDTRSSAVIDGDWKLIQWYSLEDESIERVELFNLAEDEGERNNLADEYPAKRTALEAQLNEWKESVNARLGEFKKGSI